MKNESIDNWEVPEWENDDRDVWEEIDKEIELEKLIIRSIMGTRKRALEQLED